MAFYHNILSSKISGSTGGGSTGGVSNFNDFVTGVTTVLYSDVNTIVNGAFYSWTFLKSIDLPNVEILSERAFANCSELISANLPKATNIGSNAFFGCNKLEHLNIPNVARINSYAIQSAYPLQRIDLPSCTYIDNFAFTNGRSLKAVILRSETVCTLGATNAFSGCYHILGTVHSTYNPNGDKDGYFYVPRALVESYQSATNWSNYASQFRALEDYTVDGTTTGALDPNKI